jgi:hypothetical protein
MIAHRDINLKGRWTPESGTRWRKQEAGFERLRSWHGEGARPVRNSEKRDCSERAERLHGSGIPAIIVGGTRWWYDVRTIG